MYFERCRQEDKRLGDVEDLAESVRERFGDVDSVVGQDGAALLPLAARDGGGGGGGGGGGVRLRLEVERVEEPRGK